MDSVIPSLVASLVTFFPSSNTDYETGSFYLEEALVHQIAPETVTSPYPVVMVPGLYLSSYLYLTTPDGRPGWAQQFADAGHQVYVVNDPRYDFSEGFDVEGFTEVPSEGAPPTREDSSSGWGKDIWKRWGFGHAEGNPFHDSKFPHEFMETLESNFPNVGSDTSHQLAEVIAELLERIGPAILVAHSAGAPEAIAAARVTPELIAGLVLVEPTSPPTEEDFPTLQGISMLGVYGDYVDMRKQGGRKEATEYAATLFQEHDGVGDVIDLPGQFKVMGNSHLMMQDGNNAYISRLILNWLSVHAGPPEEAGEGRPFAESVGRKGKGKKGMGKPGGKIRPRSE